MLDAHPPHFEIEVEVVFSGKLPKQFALLRSLNILLRREVVRNKSYTVSIKDILRSGLFEFLNSDRCGDVICKDKVNLCVYELTRANISYPRMCCKYLFCNGHEPSLLPQNNIIVYLYDRGIDKSRALLKNRNLNTDFPSEAFLWISIIKVVRGQWKAEVKGPI